MNLQKIQNGFNFNNTDYLFEGDIIIISENQCHIPTDLGIILLDLSCTINDVKFTDINLFIANLIL